MSQEAAAGGDGDSATVPCTLREFLLYFLNLGALGFGGPIALAGYMQRDLVERRKWISKQDYVEGLALAQLAPGPLAAQLAIYLGWVRAGLSGATLVAAAFVLPSFLMVLALSFLYVHFGGLPWMQGLFYGIGAAVIAIIARSVVKLVRMTLTKDHVLWAIFAVNTLATAWTETEIIWLFALSGIVGMLVHGRPRAARGAAISLAPWPWLVTGLKGAASTGTLFKICLYFAEAGAFVFGSGLAIVPFLHGGVVDEFQWLTDRQFLDAVAVAMITPGPVVITVAFIGYLVAGPLGSVMAAIGVFVPCYLFVIAPAPYYKRIAGNASIQAFVHGVTAAATGAIAGAGFVLGKRAVFDIPTALIMLVTLGVLTKVKKVPEPLVIVAAGLVGLLLTSTFGANAHAEKPGAAHLPLVKVADVALPGGATRFDYQDVDAAHARLVVAHMNDDSVLIVDLRDGSVLEEVTGIKTPRGVVVAGEAGTIFVTSMPNQLVSIDSTSMKETGRVETGKSPDGVSWDPKHEVVGVSDQGDGALSLIAEAGRGARKQVKLGTETGNVVFDAGRGWFWITAVTDKADQLVAVDPVSTKVETRIDLAGCRGAHGLRLHPDGKSAFVACEDNSVLARVALDGNHAVETAATGKGPDVLSLDPGLGWLYVAAESSDLTVFDVTQRGVALVGHDKPGAHTHSVAVDPATHRVFFPLQAGANGKPVLRIMRPQ
jgi:chromate transporter